MAADGAHPYLVGTTAASVSDTLSKVQTVHAIKPAVLSTSVAKIEASLSLFDNYAKTEPLMAGLEGSSGKLTPSKFLHRIHEGARNNVQRIVLPEASDHRILMAAAAAQQKGYAQMILLGAASEIEQVGTGHLTQCDCLPKGVAPQKNKSHFCAGGSQDRSVFGGC